MKYDKIIELLENDAKTIKDTHPRVKIGIIRAVKLINEQEVREHIDSVLPDEPLTISKIVHEHLKDNGYDGLCCEECGCGLDDLMPCDDYCINCVPAYINYCVKCNEKETCTFISRDAGKCYSAVKKFEPTNCQFEKPKWVIK